MTLVRHTYPRELMKALEENGFAVDKQYPGIYRIGSIAGLKIQLIVSSRLPQGEYDGLQLLAKGCTEEAVVHYAGKATASENENVKTNAETVIKTCLRINKDLDTRLKEDKVMDINKAISGIFDVVEKKSIQKGINETNERVAADMLRKKLPLSLIEEISKLSEPAIRSLAASLGISIM